MEATDNPEPSFEAMIDRRIAGEKSFVHLFAACLNAAGVRYEIGMADSRDGFRVADSVEIWSHLETYLFWLPGLNAYLSPLDEDLRFPFVDPAQCGARGIFTTSITAAETEVWPEFRTISCPPAAASSMDTKSELSFEAGLEPVVRSTQSFRGYAARPFLGNIAALPKADQQELVLQMGDLSDKPEDLREFSIDGGDVENFATAKAFEIHAVTRAPGLLEKAGPKYLVKVGALIGRQTQLYGDTKRRLPVDLDYLHELRRTLRIDLPPGYAVSGLEGLKKDVVSGSAAAPDAIFRSDYKLERNVLTINIIERYSQLHYPVAAYQSYRKVVNAAADFNKAVVVLRRVE
jgi:hypothetical protein